MVTIIGGGIAGTILGGALARRGDQVTLFERQSRNATGGAFLFIDERGHSVLHDLGVDDDVVNEASYPVSALEYVGSNGRRAAMSRGHRFWLRSSLMKVLNDFVDISGADLRYDCGITDVTVDEPGRCRIQHSDGSSSTTDDIVIAADGIDSVVRARLEPDRNPVYAGDVVLYGMTSTPTELDTEPQTLHFFAELDATGAAASTFGHIWRPGHTAHWFIRIARAPLDGPDDFGVRPTSEWTDTVLQATPSINDLVSTLLDRTDSVHVSNARNVPLDAAAQPTLPVLLIGDADHAITPAAGVGAREALEDAHAVYRALTTGSCPAEAMALRRSEIIDDRQRAVRGRASVSR
ncbi:FAD-dependent monooxygenase [Nocardia sp. NBC_00508]|uniref:FAD-dependent monooxygenase n=1 Tax=Nocardia sp. NBC_00508 TaxID=2975992 RepID=UPI002E815DC5|nr:FAD-dependent monooxygenase [Nocardia sp. NBC_00508]WUD67943.1 FAD-dependent monooxygenase [Nocardia sp. NBC_00508]